MKINLIGVGMGNPDLLTKQAQTAIENADCLVGAARILEPFAALGKPAFTAVSPEEIAAYLAKLLPESRAAVLVSGDVGFYSLAGSLRRLLEDAELESFCGISSLQYFCAKLNLGWDAVKIISLHGREQNLLGAICANPQTFVLTGGKQTVSAICRMLAAGESDSGFAQLQIHVGERLSYPGERITHGTPEELAEQEFDPLAVMLITNPAAWNREEPVTHGLPDEAFLRGDAPMTKAEVRAVSIAKLKLKRGQTVWDVGAGTGSVAAEIARVLYDGQVYAVERDEDALALLKQNRMRLHVKNMHIVHGSAPLSLEPLPAPDAVFIGGSAGRLPQILALALAKNPETRIVINAITLETVSTALECLNRFGLCDQEVVQITAAKSKPVGGSHMMMGQNPVYIISAGGGKPADA